MANFKDLVLKNTFMQTLSIFFLILFFMVFSATPIKFFSSWVIFPNISIILIFYFFIMNREETPYFLIFICGILFDAFNDMPLGLTSLTWLISTKIIMFLRVKFYTADNFLTLFRDFVIFSFLNLIISMLILTVATRTIYSWYKPLCQFILDVLFFAICYNVLSKMKKYLN